MKKIIIFLLTIILFGTVQTVNAESFYEAEYIDGIYTKSINGNSANYQKARFFRRTSDNKAAYCIEPFATFNSSANYEAHNNYATTIDNNTWYKMGLIAHFGYGYDTHTDPKWYAITQFMLWNLAEPKKEFYFTDTLNGTRINAYTNEINEINNLANNFDTLPNINPTPKAVIGSTLILTDTNNVLNNYTLSDNKNGKIKIENNQLIIEDIEEGEINFSIKREIKDDNEATIFYYSNSSQNIMTKGYVGFKKINIQITGTTNKIKITKIDKDTNSIKPSGEAKLNGAIYGLYDANENLIKEITFDDNSTAIIENLDYGSYYLQEIKPGNGYTLNKEKTNFTVNENTSELNIKLTNKVIEKEIIIHKEYGEQGNTTNEINISFDIFNSNNELINTITTDNEGNAKITLPYGKYLIKQRNTTTGYNKVDDFEIDINNNTTNDYYYKLYDYKLEIPNTGIKESNSSFLLIFLIIPLVLITKNNYVKYHNI